MRRIALTLLGFLAPASVAWAQDEPAGSMVESIEVIGQRTPSDAESTSPVSIISSDTLERNGVVTIDDAFNNIPAISFQGINGAQNDGGYGAVFADLRNLNFNRTVTLVNGRRFVLSGITTDEAVDLNNIPVSLIDHVEVLRDGSEPEFGADSVAGVINIVLRHDFEGMRATGLLGGATAGDASEYDASLTLGHQFGNTHVTFDVGRSHHEPLDQSNRSWARNPITEASFNPDGSLALERGLSATADGHAISSTGIDDLVTGSSASQPFDGKTDGYDFSRDQFLSAGQDRTIANLLIDTDLTSSVSAFAEVLLGRRTSQTQVSPQALGLAGTAKHPEGFVIPASNPFNFFGENVTLQRVLSEVGPRQTETQADTFRFVVGLQGEWRGGDWTISYNHGQVDQTFTTRNAVNLTRAIQTLSSDPSVCVAADGCVQADYFGPGSLSPAAVDFISYTARGTSAYREDILSAALEQTFLTLPAGDWEFTLGAEHVIESGRVTPDAVTLAGDQAGSDSAPTDGTIASDAVFVDLDLPMLSEHSSIGALRADIGARYSRYDYFGSFPTWRVGLSWAPTEDIRFRFTTGAARRIPAITEAFGGSTSQLLSVQDPCDSVSGSRDNPIVDANCTNQGLDGSFTQSSPLIAVANGGSTTLRPEASRNYSAGFVFTPRAVPNLTIIADYYRIRIKDAIDSLADTNPDFIPDQCYETPGLASPYCALVTRAPSGPSAGQINLIFAPDANLGEIITDGVDVGLTYSFELGNWGRLTLDWQNSVLLNYLIRETPGGEQVQYAGKFPGLNFVGSYPRLRSVLDVTLEHGPWSFNWTTRYIGEADLLDEDPSETPFTHADAIFYHDIEASWRHDYTRIIVGVNNLFDERPPTLVDGSTNTDVATYDVLGRFAFVRVAFTL